MSVQSIEPSRTWQPVEPKPFDYAVLPAEVRSQLKAAAARVRKRHRQQAASIIESGRDLIAAKEALPHGAFGPWLAAEFGWEERTARNYMTVAAKFGSKSETVSDLPATTLYALASPSVPVVARNTVLTRLDAGEKVSPLEVRRIIYDAKEAEKEAERIAKLTPEEKKRAAAAAKAGRDRKDRLQREWEAAQAARKKGENEAADEAAHLIYDALGDAASHLEKLLTSGNVGMHLLCRKLRERITPEVRQ